MLNINALSQSDCRNVKLATYKVKPTPIPGKFVYSEKRCTGIGIEAFLLSQQESLKFQL